VKKDKFAYYSYPLGITRININIKPHVIHTNNTTDQTSQVVLLDRAAYFPNLFPSLFNLSKLLPITF
jgi:hypothetical protein